MKIAANPGLDAGEQIPNKPIHLESLDMESVESAIQLEGRQGRQLSQTDQFDQSERKIGLTGNPE